MSKIMFIYTLSDPITNEIRYIGKTNNIKDRLKRHLQKSNLDKYEKNTHKSRWIRSMLICDKSPNIEILDIGNTENVNDLEIYWISQFKTWGFNLTNLSAGGEVGVDWTGKKHKDTTKNKIRDSHNSRNKNIIHYKLDGSIIGIYPSLKEASLKTKNHISLISNCCKRKGSYTVGGKHFWRGIELNEPTTFRYEGDIFTYVSYNKNIQINSKKVCKYDINGVVIKTYDSIRNAEIENNTTHGNIRSCCKRKINKKTGKYVIVKGFTWRYFSETNGNNL